MCRVGSVGGRHIIIKNIVTILLKYKLHIIIRYYSLSQLCIKGNIHCISKTNNNR
jgi:hypothetical protein